ncbi:MAG: DUF1499 domain-containing protein [Geminicoccaceae bacterium]|nr:MAG: DUF1499 domain-containing protein [Geminicoccaceae bacterium]
MRHQRRTTHLLSALSMLALLAACSPGQPSFVELATLERSPTPNDYLVCPQSLTTAQVDRDPPISSLEVAALERHWLTALESEPRTRRLASEADAQRHLFLQRTRVLRFPDLIQIDFVALPDGGSTLCLYSRSRYGHSDLGQNRRRIEDWLNRIGVPSPPAG